MTEEMILIDSPEAASLQTVEGWVSRSGRFFGKGPHAERLARYDGCTHRRCERCETPIPIRAFTKCDSCRSDYEAEAFANMPRAEWDGKAMVYSQTKDQFYSSPEDAEDYLEEGETMESLRLVICEPQHARTLDFDDFYDAMPEDAEELPDDLEAAVTAFNAAVANMEPLSWSPGRTALELPPNDGGKRRE